MKNILNPPDDAPLNKTLYFSSLNILCKSVLQIENKYYLGGCEYGEY